MTFQASVVVSGLLAFWPDFFALWTHGVVPYHPALAITLLVGTAAIAPSILALSYANYSNRGDLLVRTKGLQLAVFLVLSVLLIRPFLGTARCRNCCGRERSAGSVWPSGLDHYRSDASKTASACRFARSRADISDAWGLGIGRGYPIRAARNRVERIPRLMCALANHCPSGRQPNSERKVPQKIGRHASEMMIPDCAHASVLTYEK